MVAPTATAPRSKACWTLPNMIWSYSFGTCRNALWFSFAMKGMRCTYLRDARPSVPSVVATALHSPARASSRMFSGSK